MNKSYLNVCVLLFLNVLYEQLRPNTDLFFNQQMNCEYKGHSFNSVQTNTL